MKLLDAGLDRLASASTMTADRTWGPMTSSAWPQKPCICSVFSADLEPFFYVRRASSLLVCVSPLLFLSAVGCLCSL